MFWCQNNYVILSKIIKMNKDWRCDLEALVHTFNWQNKEQRDFNEAPAYSTFDGHLPIPNVIFLSQTNGN